MNEEEFEEKARWIRKYPKMLRGLGKLKGKATCKQEGTSNKRASQTSTISPEEKELEKMEADEEYHGLCQWISNLVPQPTRMMVP